MIATNLGRFLEKVTEADASSRPLFVTHVSRHDIILGFIAHAQKCKLEGRDYGGAMILSGPVPKHTVMPYIVDMIKTYDLPVLHAPMQTYEIMEAMLHFTPKMHEEDLVRADVAANHYRQHSDVNRILGV